MNNSDRALIEQFRQTGNQKALDELLSRHLAGVRNTVFQMVLDHEAADDITQDIFVRVVHGMEQFEGRSEFATWLYQITMNTTRTYLTGSGRRRKQSAELRDHFTTTRNMPDGPVLQAELETEVQTALEQLTPPLRAAIVLVCLQSRSAADAAQIEGCSTDTMYWRVHEARRQLKQLLAEHMS